MENTKQTTTTPEATSISRSDDAYEPARLSRRTFLAQSATAAGLTLGTASLLSACVGAPNVSKGPVTIHVMYNGGPTGDGAISDRWRKMFEKQNPDIKVNLLAVNMSTLSTMLASGKPPDIAWTFGGPDILNYMARGLTADLSSYFRTSSLIKESDLVSVCDYYRWDGKVQGQGPRCGLPQDWGQDGMYWYDTAPFDAANVPYPDDSKPMTWNELLALEQKVVVRQKGGIKTYGGDAPGWIPYVQLLTALEQNNASLFTNADLSEVDFTQPEVKKICEWYMEWGQAHVGISPLDTNTQWIDALMEAKRYALGNAGYWYGGYMASSSAPTRARLRLLPAPQWGSTRISTCGGGTGMWIPKKAPNLEAAWKFFEFYMGGPPADYRASGGGGLSIFKSKLAKMPNATPADQQAYKVQLAEIAYQKNLKFTPYASSNSLLNVISSGLSNAMKSTMSLDTALHTMNDGANALLTQGKSIIG